MDMDDSTISKRDVQLQASSYHRSNSTAATVESDWESHVEESTITVSLSPWSLYQTIRNTRILTVEPVVFLYFFGVYFMFTLVQQYYLKRFSEDVLRNTSYPYALNGRCIDKEDVNNFTGDNSTYGREVESNATLIYMYKALASTLLATVTTLIMGPLSDRYGRRLVILSVAVGSVFQGLGSLAIVYFNLDLRYFVVIGVIEGCFGNFASLLMASFSYVSDISFGKWRTVRIGVVESMLFLSGIFALKLGAFWYQKVNCDLMPLLYLYIACNFCIVGYTVFFLPESLTSEERQRKNSNKPSGIKALIRGANIFFCQVSEYQVWKLWLALLGTGMVLAITIAGSSISTFYFGDLNWSPKKTGNYQTVSTGSHMLSLMVVLPVLVALKLPDPLICLIGIAFNVSMNLFIGLSSATYLIFIAGSLSGLEALAVTPLRGYMSKIVHVEDQGALYSVIAAVESSSSLLSVAYTYILPVLLHHHVSPGMVYVILAGLGLIPVPFISALLVAWCRVKFSEKIGKPLNLSGKASIQSRLVSENTPILAGFSSPPKYSSS